MKSKEHTLFDARDNFHLINSWPLDFKRLFYLRHLNYAQRFKFFRFLYLNGLPPQDASDVVLHKGGYDNGAKSQLRGLVKTAKSSDPRDRDTVKRWTTYYMDHYDSDVST
jgi:hypothetical protein